MAIPGFTAEATLSRTPGSYTGGASSARAAAPLIPQIDPYAACRNDCVDCLISGPTSYFCDLCQRCIELVNTSFSRR